MDLSNKTLEKTIDIININNIIKKHTNKIEGCCLYQHQSNFLQFEEGNRYDNKLILRRNFFNIVKDAKNIYRDRIKWGTFYGYFFVIKP